MKPVAIFRHSPGEGPGYFASFLEHHAIDQRLIHLDEGEAVPDGVEAFSGLCFMGGPMSVNDDLPWIAPVLALIRTAVAQGIPVLGHCLGGQLVSKALGGVVTKNAVKEIGWGEVRLAAPALGTALAQQWLGDIERFEAFHWHGETFSLPEGAHWLLQSAHCAHQAFVLGPHLALQCHVEMTEAMIRLWCRQWPDECAAPGASVQTPAQMQEDLAGRIARMRRAADRLYTRWIAGLDRR